MASSSPFYPGSPSPSPSLSPITFDSTMFLRFSDPSNRILFHITSITISQWYCVQFISITDPNDIQRLSDEYLHLENLTKGGAGGTWGCWRPRLLLSHSFASGRTPCCLVILQSSSPFHMLIIKEKRFLSSVAAANYCCCAEGYGDHHLLSYTGAWNMFN